MLSQIRLRQGMKHSEVEAVWGAPLIAGRVSDAQKMNWMFPATDGGIHLIGWQSDIAPPSKGNPTVFLQFSVLQRVVLPGMSIDDISRALHNYCPGANARNVFVPDVATIEKGMSFRVRGWDCNLNIKTDSKTGRAVRVSPDFSHLYPFQEEVVAWKRKLKATP
jgi:hypothetical protein